MDGWKIRRAVDLQEDSPPVERLRALATLSSRQAHDFVIVVLDGDKPADLTGMQPWLSMILPGRASLQKQVGSVQANVVSVTLPKIGYAERGDVSIILSLMDEDGQTQIPLYGCVIRVMEDSTDTIIDEEKVIPSLAELLAQFDACKAAAGAANTAAGKAISAASGAQKVANDVQKKLDNGEFVGAQGPKGEKGDTGAQGPRGEKVLHKLPAQGVQRGRREVQPLADLGGDFPGVELRSAELRHAAANALGGQRSIQRGLRDFALHSCRNIPAGSGRERRLSGFQNRADIRAYTREFRLVERLYAVERLRGVLDILAAACALHVLHGAGEISVGQTAP